MHSGTVQSVGHLHFRQLSVRSYTRKTSTVYSHTLTLFFQLCTQIEQLEEENRGLKEGGGAASTSNPASSPVDGELLRLQAENATLQKKMKGV